MEKLSILDIGMSSNTSKGGVGSKQTTLVSGGTSAKPMARDLTGASIQKANLFNVQQSSKQGIERRFGGGVWKYSSESENIYLQAEFLMEMLAKQRVTITTLNVEQKMLIFLYLYKYSSKMGRIIDLFVNIPLSGMELRYPDELDNPILSDFVKDFYNRMWNSSSMQKTILKAYRDYRIFGYSAVLVSDDFSFSQTVLNKDGTIEKEDILNPLDLEETLKKLAKEPLDEKTNPKAVENLKEVTNEYLKAKESISLEDKQKVIYSFVVNLQDSDLVTIKEDSSWLETYQGIRFIKNIDPFDALNRASNVDINYHRYTLRPDESLINLYSDMDANASQEELARVEKYLVSLGYSKSYLSAFSKNEDGVTVDTFPFNSSDIWVATLENDMAYSRIDKSILNRVVNQALDMEVVAKANRSKANRAYKSIYLFSTEESGENFTYMDGLLKEAVESDESSYIFTNKTINQDTIAFDSRQIIDLDSMAQKAEDDLVSGLGMVDTLTGSADSYANSYLKLEMLGKEFTNERVTISAFIEEQILKPIAIKKGLFIKDAWGHVKPIYPRVVFDRINFARNSEDFQLLLSLASDGKIPYSYILKALNFDPVEIQRLVVEEQSTSVNSELLGYVTQKLTENEEFAKFVIEDAGHIKSVLTALNIPADDEIVKSVIQRFRKGTLTEDEVEEVADELYDKYVEDHPEDEAGAEASEEDISTQEEEGELEQEDESTIEEPKSLEEEPLEEEPLKAVASEHKESLEGRLKKTFPELEDISIIENIDALTLSKIVVTKDQRKKGVGEKVMEEIVKYADKNNLTIKLTPSKDFGATSVGRLKKFYKRFGFVENKGKNKDYSIGETMYRLSKNQTDN
jgi:GNAT superfamily N-acetyltransferase